MTSMQKRHTATWVLIAVWLVALFTYRHYHHKPAPAQSARVPTQVSSVVPPQVHSARPVYNYSLVPGGIGSLQEYQALAAKDPLLAKLNWGAAIASTVPADMHVFVSYRKNGRVYWTKHPVLIHAGEAILTDGVTTILARCGNQISWAPMDPTGSVPGELLDTIVDAPPIPDGPITAGDAPPVDLTPTPVMFTPAPPTFLPPPTYPPVYYPPTPPCCFITPGPPTAVPEPRTDMLMLLGIAAIGVLWTWTKHKNDKDNTSGGAGA